MFKINKKASNWSLAFALAAGVGGGTSLPVLAGDEGMFEEVVVTGSRIRRSNAKSSTPLTVVTSQELDGVGTTNIGVFLEKLPSNIAASNQSNNTFTGNSFGLLLNSLRGLGSTRTLTLVNGKRFVSGVTPNVGYGVDNSMIPTPLIERVEIVTGGVSAVYGSDAIAGVINIILKDDFEGVSFNTRTGVSAESDRETTDVDLTLGANFDKGNAYISIGYSDEEGLFARDRGQIDLIAFDTDDDGIRDTHGFLGSSGLPGGNFDGFFGDGTPANLGSGPGSELTSDRYNRGGERALFNPLERRYARAGVSYELTDKLNVKIDAGYSEVNTFTEIESYFYNITDEVLTKNNQTVFGDIDIASNLVMPEALKQALLGEGHTTLKDVADSGGLTVRRMTDIGNRGGIADRNTMYLNGSVDYEINDDFTAEVYGSWGRTRFITDTQGVINNDRVRNGFDLESVDGVVRCVSAVARAEGCVPINLYAPAGQMTAAEIAYITTSATSSSQAEQTVLGGVVSGETPFELAGGRIGVAAGIEYRKEKGFVKPSSIVQAGSTTTNQSNPTQGEFDVTDYFAEVRIPVMDKLILEAAIRVGDYSTIGDTTTWKIGFEAPILDWVKLRGTVSESVRAPNIAELFNGGGETFATVNDLCDEVTATTAGIVADNCRAVPIIASRIATGLGNDDGEVGVFRLTQTELQGTGGVVGGNPNVGEETAESWTLGAVVNIPIIEGLAFGVDWYDISVDGAISATSRSEVLRRCFNAPTGSFDPTCGGLLTRNNLGAATAVNSSQSNENNRQVSGLDLDVTYSTEVSELNSNLRGSLNLNLLYNFQNENEQTGITSGLTDDFVGEVLYPEHRWTLSATYNIDDLTVQWRTRYWAEVVDANEASDGGRVVNSPLNDLDGVFYHDLRGGYDINDNINVYFGINNLLDQEPEVIGQSTNYGNTGINTASEAYDVIGRRYYAGISVDF